MKHADLTEKQRKVLDLLASRPDRDLYEGSAPPNGKFGSGQFWLTYSADEVYSPLGWGDVRQLEDAGLIVERWPGCYMLAGAKREESRARRKR